MAQIDMNFIAVLPVLPRRGQGDGADSGGRIVNVAARPALEWRSRRRHGRLCRGKAAVAALTVALAGGSREGRHPGQCGRAVDHGHAGQPQGMPKADFATWPKVEEVAATIVFLASPENRVTRGAIVPVYGKSTAISSPRSAPARAAAFHQALHVGDATDGAALRIGLVVLLDLVEIVEVVHHQPVRLLDGALGGVGEPVDALEPRAVAEMEARHRIDRQAARVLARAR